MDHRTIGNSDITVPSICLGTMTWGQQNSESEAHEQLDFALNKGINFFDTAEIYPIPPEAEKQGRTESYIGSWIKKRGKRDDLIIATKVGASPVIVSREHADGGRPRYDKKSITEALEGSLKRLNTDYVDLYQVHWPERKTNFFGIRGYAHDPSDDATAIEETLTALGSLVDAGKVRAIGVSNETPWGIARYLRVSEEKKLPRIISIQNQYSLINRTYEIGLAEFSLREHVSLLAYSPLSMGALTGKYLDGKKPENARFTLFERNQERYNPPHAQEAIRLYVSIAQRYDLDPAAMAIAFINSQPFVASTIIGATTLEQLAVNIEAGNMVLSDEVLSEIQEVYSSIPDPTV